ncbi:MAG: type II secretion system F family protein [Lachnospiraceae bacterium]|nr:type II secretion system F family protein [Lachnospiraceae bacterium]
MKRKRHTKKKEKASILKRGTAWCYEKFWRQRGSAKDRKLMGSLRLLYPVSEKELEQMVQAHRKEQIRLVLLFSIVLLAAGILMILLSFVPPKSIQIERNDYGDGERTETVYQNGKEAIEFDVGEQEYGEEELEEAFKTGFETLKKEMLGENTSSSEVRSSLKLLTEAPGGLKAEWVSGNPDIIGEDGTLYNEDWDEKRKELVDLTLLLSYGSKIESQEYHLYVQAPILSANEKLQKKIRDTITGTEEKTRTQKTFTLPSVIEGIQIERTQSAKQRIIILFLIVILFILMFYLKHTKLKERIEKRQQEVLEDYPGIVNQLVLYLGAGMNLKAAFEKMSDQYQQDRQSGRKEFRYAYQELYVMMNQLKTGTSERMAYEQYAKRMGENCYLRLMTLVVQNLQKGTLGLLKALSEEEESAFAKRLDRARKKGEEAGTRLLFPMLLLLVVVMAVVMLPAVFQFQSY